MTFTPRCACHRALHPAYAGAFFLVVGGSELAPAFAWPASIAAAAALFTAIIYSLPLRVVALAPFVVVFI